ncbi:MAG: PT domain-containing protein [Ruminococcus sp.]
MKNTKKILSVILSVLLVFSSILCTTVMASAAEYSVGDIVLYKYVVQTDTQIEAFEGSVSYPSDSLKIESDDYITVYNGSTGSFEAHDCGDTPGTVAFNASSSSPVYNFTKGAAMIQISFEVTSSDFDPADISTTLSNIYDDEGHINKTNNPYNYKNVIVANDSVEKVISGGYVDIDNGISYTTAPTEPESTDYVVPGDTLYLDYSVNGGHQFDNYDTPFTNNNDGTYSVTIPYTGANTTCAIYNETTGSYYTVSALTSKTLQLGAEPESVSLVEKSSRTPLIFRGTETGSLVLTYDYDNMILSYELMASEPETTEPTEAPTEEPTEAPTEAPTEEPTEAPTTAVPTEEPTEAPTEVSAPIFYYVPTQADVNAGYNFRLYVRVVDENGKASAKSYVMTETDKTYKGVPIYSYTFDNAISINSLKVQTYEGGTWKSQLDVANSTTSEAMNNKMLVKATKKVIDYACDVEQTFYYVPTQTDINAGYNFRLYVRIVDENGKASAKAYAMTETDKTYNGVAIYSYTFDNAISINSLKVQTYDGGTWKSQVDVANSTTSELMNNKMYVKSAKTIVDYACDVEQTFYYVPTQTDVDAGYNFRLYVRIVDENGKASAQSYVMTETGKTYNGVAIYSYTFNNSTSIDKLKVQTYEVGTWKSQLDVANSTTSEAMNNKMFVKSSKTVMDYICDVE